MKSKLLTTLAVFSGLCMVGTVSADQGANKVQPASVSSAIKMGYVNLGYVLENLPEAQKRDAEMQTFYKQLENEIQDKVKELQAKVEAAQQQQDTLTEAQKKQKQLELNKLNMAIEELDSQRTPKLQKKYKEVMKPLHDQLQVVIHKVAEEQGYAFVFSKDIMDPNSPLPTLLYAKDEFNISSIVLESLKAEGLKNLEVPVVGPKEDKSTSLADKKKAPLTTKKTTSPSTKRKPAQKK